MTDVLDEVYAVIADRKAHPKEGSYTTSLYNHRKGLDKVLEKIGEESTELIIAAKNGGEKEIVGECADLFFHAMVLLASKDIPLEKVKEEFEAAEIILALYSLAHEAAARRARQVRRTSSDAAGHISFECLTRSSVISPAGTMRRCMPVTFQVRPHPYIHVTMLYIKSGPKILFRCYRRPRATG